MSELSFTRDSRPFFSLVIQSRRETEKYPLFRTCEFPSKSEYRSMADQSAELCGIPGKTQFTCIVIRNYNPY